MTSSFHGCSDSFCLTFRELYWVAGGCVVVSCSGGALAAVFVLDWDGTFAGGCFACGGLSWLDEIEFFCCKGAAAEVEDCAIDFVCGVFTGYTQCVAWMNILKLCTRSKF